MPDNVLIIDSDYEEANGFVKGLKESTKEDWNKIVKLYSWDYLSFIKIIHCTDGDINL